MMPVVLNPDGRLPGLIVVDHAGTETPDALGPLRLDPHWHGTHHFCDLGAADLARALAGLLDVPVVLCPVSRLVIDVNRWLDDPRLILTEVDGAPIPGNLTLSPDLRQARIDGVFWPYHAAIAQVWARQTAQHARPFFLALHSCARTFGGARRPWDGGTIWHDDRRMSDLMLRSLGQDGRLTLGDNQPYSGLSGVYTVDRHCYGTGLPACGFEVTNDQLETPDGIARWAGLLARALTDVMRQDGTP